MYRRQPEGSMGISCHRRRVKVTGGGRGAQSRVSQGEEFNVIG